MKTKTLKKNKVNVITLGCSKNTFDSEVLMAQLNANKFDVEHESTSDDAEIVIINTCGFIDNAKQESIDMIIQYVDAKAEGLVEKVFVLKINAFGTFPKGSTQPLLSAREAE